MHVDFKSPEFRRDPYATYKRLRSDAPVLRIDRRMMGPAYHVSRYDDVSRVLRDDTTFTSDVRSVNGGNVLTRKTLGIIRETLPEGFDLPLTIYGERSALSAATLGAENIVFRQTPYDVKARR